MNYKNSKIAIIGLGYVGLPLAVEFGKKRDVIGFDISANRIKQLAAGNDVTLEIDDDELVDAKHLQFTNSIDALENCDIFIVTVPTPIDQANRPDLGAIKSASHMLGLKIRKNSIVIYESTVFPGCTNEVCVPILEEASNLKHNVDFFTGYSPERINPGDKQHRLPSIVKVTSGSTSGIAAVIDDLYASIITAGTFKAASIEVAEAAKVIENTQRDLNIALMNELSIIFHRLNIDTTDVLEAAGTKWNFLNFRPGLVGGHCIGVDPYYLTHRAQEVGYHPEVILAGRRINDGMGPYVADRVSRAMMKKNLPVVGSRILILGLTFKENCPDLRNSRVIDVIAELESFNALVDVHDPWASKQEALDEYGVELLNDDVQDNTYDAIILAVGHDQYKLTGAAALRKYGKETAILFDVKSVFSAEESDGRL